MEKRIPCFFEPHISCTDQCPLFHRNQELFTANTGEQFIEEWKSMPQPEKDEMLYYSLKLHPNLVKDCKNLNSDAKPIVRYH